MFFIGISVKYPSFIYENLPYIYFCISGFLLVNNTSEIIFISATIFYCAGCITLVTRSAHRRIDKQKKLENKMPELIYEYLPYIYIASAIFMLMVTTNAIVQFFSFILIVVALRNLLCRRANRIKN